jgi:hypothetical protein
MSGEPADGRRRPYGHGRKKMLTSRSQILTPQTNNIPQVLKDVLRWTNWRAESSKKKPGTLDKVPYCSKNTRRRASHSDPATWADYMAAYDAYRLNGEPPLDGFFFACGAGFGGVDLDDCIDPVTGEITAFAQDVIRAVDSYTEKSVSGTGIRIFVRMPEAKGTKQHPIEIYSVKRFLSVTGHHIPGTRTTVEDRSQEVESIRQRLLDQRAQSRAAKSSRAPSHKTLPVDSGVASPNVTALGISDDEVLEVCRTFRNFSSLWSGDTSGYESRSQADMALAGLLAFACGPDEPERVERLMRRSNLARDEKWDRPDYLPTLTIPNAYRDRTEYYAWPERDPALPSSTAARPTIVMGPETDAILRQLETHLAPHLFQRDGRLVEVREADIPQATDDIRRKPGSLVVEDVAVEQVQRLMSRHVVFRRRALEASPGGKPRWVMTQIAAPPPLAKVLAHCGSWAGIPNLIGITGTPYIRRDGLIVDTPGHDAATGYLFISGGIDWPAVPLRPTPGQLQTAVDLLLDVVCDFPFATGAHRSAWLATLLSVIARPAIHGPVPLLWIDSPRAGTGKTKLANIIGLLANGFGATELSFTQDEKELENRLGSLLLAGDRFAFFDNAVGSVRNPALDRFLTSTNFGFRLYFKQKIAKPRNTATLSLTGNNLVLRGDLARRVVRVRLVTDLEHPEKRSGFRHSDLEGYVRDNRPALIAAALTILRAHAAAGFPVHPGVAPLGSFSEWEQVVRHALLTAGLPDPVATQEEVHEEDEDRAKLLAVMRAWHLFNPGLSGTATHIVAAVMNGASVFGSDDAGHFREAIMELTGVPCDHPSCARTLGYRFRDANEKRIDVYRVVRDRGRTRGGIQWRLIHDGEPKTSPSTQAAVTNTATRPVAPRDSGRPSILRHEPR